MISLVNVLLLLRHTGMRIGECVDLSLDSLRPLGPDQWVLHVPLGKLGTERWVPVDSVVCQLVERILLLLRAAYGAQCRSSAIASASRPLRADSQAPRSIARSRVGGRNPRPHRAAPISTHIRGRRCCALALAFAAVIKLLGHKSPHMTMQYLEITQQDLQREFHLALSCHPGTHCAHLRRMPSPLAPCLAQICPA